MTGEGPSSPVAIRFDPWRHRYTVLLCAATVVLLMAGGLVTSTGSGLAVPDWPLSFGKVFPPMQGGVLFEHGHRLVAATVGMMTVVLAAGYARRERRRGVRLLSYAALGAVVLQGALGGLTVLLRLPTSVSVAHACLAQLYFCSVVTLAHLTSRSFVENRPRPSDSMSGGVLFPCAAGVTVLVYAQLILGAILRHTGAGLAIPDVPLAFGRVVPPFLSFEIGIHFAHRVTGVLIGMLVAGLAVLVGREIGRPDLQRPARAALALVAVQILLGAASVVTRLAVIPTTAHVVTGALLLATLLTLTLRSRRAGVWEAQGACPSIGMGRVRRAAGPA